MVAYLEGKVTKVNLKKPRSELVVACLKGEVSFIAVGLVIMNTQFASFCYQGRYILCGTCYSWAM